MDNQKETLVQRAKNEMEKRFSRLVGLSSSNLCVRCGLCVDACHYILSDGKDLAVSPVAKAERIRSVYKRHHDWLSKVFPWWTGAKMLNEDELKEWREVAYKNCSMCQRCTAPSWYEKPWPFKVRNLIEVIDAYLQTGRIKVDPHKIKGSYTLHDSCNLARNSGIIEEPRRILKAIIQDFREMTPNKERNICCGGGLVANPEWEETRLKAGKPKADQIKATGAENVVASCDNCLHQLGEISDFYKLDTKVTGLSELVSEAMLL